MRRVDRDGRCNAGATGETTPRNRCSDRRVRFRLRTTLLQIGALRFVAGTAQELQISKCVGAAQLQWDHVIKF